MNVQLKKGVLDVCVLRLLKEEPTYGYDIYQKIHQVMPISESTIYPILRKMVQQHWVTTSLENSSEGPPRRYFKLTGLGHQMLEVFMVEWQEFQLQIQTLLGEKSS